jgi:thymidylate kinase
MIFLGKILLNPDVVIVIANDSETRFERDTEKDSYEKDARLQARVAALYKKFCNNKTIIQVKATGTIEEVFDRIKLVLNDFNMMYLSNSKR